MSQQPRTQVSTEGVFMSVPGAFDRVDIGLRHAFKLQFSPVLSGRREGDGTTRMAVGAAFAMDRVLLDFGAVRPAAVDFGRAKRDCELLKEALDKHPEAFTQALQLFTTGPADMARALTSAGWPMRSLTGTRTGTSRSAPRPCSADCGTPVPDDLGVQTAL